MRWGCQTSLENTNRLVFRRFLCIGRPCSKSRFVGDIHRQSHPSCLTLSIVDKMPAVGIRSTKMKEDVNVPVSPKGSPLPMEEEIRALRTQNRILLNAIKAIKETADKEAKKHHDLVWFARNRSKSFCSYLASQQSNDGSFC